jgi:hypothetical protein
MMIREVLVVGGVVGALAVAGVAEAQTTFERAWIDVNFGSATAGTDAFAMNASTEIDEEQADFGAHFNLPRGASFDFGGGFMFMPAVGIGVSFSGTAHEDVVDLSARIPHPIFFNTFANDNAETDDLLQRTESGVHIHAMLVPVQTDRFRLRVFGGPSYLRVEQDTITDIRYSQTYTFFPATNRIEITGSDIERLEANAWGFHAGGDASFFFTRVFGVGGFVRYSKANIDLENTIATALDQDEVVRIKAGGIQLGGGLRLKF